MVIAVIIVRMMQSAIHKIIDVIAMGNRLMTAIRAVFMFCVMAASYRITAIRVFLTDLQYMLINVIAMRMVKMAIVQIINMITVSDCRMTAAFPVLVRVVFVMFFIA